MGEQLKVIKGACHCQKVRFEIQTMATIDVYECNCSICQRSGYLHLEVPKSRFKLISGEDNLTTYRFNTGVAQHIFCKTCGIKSFYVPRSFPEGYSVNVNCLDKDNFDEINVIPFDGQNWERAKRETHKAPPDG